MGEKQRSQIEDAPANSRRDARQILVVDDDQSIRSQLQDGLALDGYGVEGAEDVQTALRALRRTTFDLILLDVNLPEQSGYDLLRALRGSELQLAAGSDRNLPVLMLSGRSAELDRVRGFEFGCDDFVVKPFSFSELRGRIAALLRRANGRRNADHLTVGSLEVDCVARAVTVGGRAVRLTVKEYALLLALADEPERVFTREELLETVWGYRNAESTRTLDAHACRLRSKLAVGRESFVINLWGVGYRLTDNSRKESLSC